jgi:hypothetical protein
MASILSKIQSLCFRSQPTIYDEVRLEWGSDVEITRSTFEKTMEPVESGADNVTADDEIELFPAIDECNAASIEMHDSDGKPLVIQAFDDAGESYPDFVSPLPPTSDDEAAFVDPRDYDVPEKKRKGRSFTFVVLLALLALALVAFGSSRGQNRNATVANAAIAAPESDVEGTNTTIPPTGTEAPTSNLTIPEPGDSMENMTTPESTMAPTSNGTDAIPESTFAPTLNGTDEITESTPVPSPNGTDSVTESTLAPTSNGTDAVTESTPELSPETNLTEAPETNSTETGDCETALSVSKTCYTPDKRDRLIISLSQCNPGRKDWIGIYADEGQDPEALGDDYESWVWSCDSKKCGGDTYKKVLRFDKNLSDGRYRAFLVQDNPNGPPYTRIASSGSFVIATTCF